MTPYQQLRRLIPDFTPTYFGRRGSQVAGGYISGERFLSQLLTNTGWNLYVGVNPATLGPSGRANTRSVKELRNVLIDIDPISPDAEPDNALIATYLSLCNVLGKGALDFTRTVFSGRGYQIWLRSQPVVLEDDNIRNRISRGIGAFLRTIDCGAFGCRVDTSCSDLSRVARLPGSINQKTGQSATLLDADPEETTEGGVDKDYFLDLAGEDPEPPKTLQNADDKSLGFLLPYLSAKAVRFLTEGVAEPGRHAAAYAAAASLRDTGISLERAYFLVRKGAALCNPPLPPSEANRSTKSAYESYRKTH